MSVDQYTNPMVDNPAAQYQPPPQGIVAPKLLAITLTVIAAYIFLKPYYLLPSGYPQMADGVLCLGIATAYMMQPRIGVGSIKKFSQFVILFCLYAAVVSAVWAAFL